MPVPAVVRRLVAGKGARWEEVGDEYSMLERLVPELGRCAACVHHGAHARDARPDAALRDAVLGMVVRGAELERRAVGREERPEVRRLVLAARVAAQRADGSAPGADALDEGREPVHHEILGADVVDPRVVREVVHDEECVAGAVASSRLEGSSDVRMKPLQRPCRRLPRRLSWRCRRARACRVGSRRRMAESSSQKFVAPPA